MTTTQAKPRRRFFRYSLRTMMLVVTVFCILMGTVVKRAWDQRQAVDAIIELGGGIVYEHNMYVNELEQPDPPGPEWLRHLIGDEYFFSVSWVSLNGPHLIGPTWATDRSQSKFNDSSLAAIKRFNDLKTLSCVNSPITDAGLVHLKGLTSLETLDLRFTLIDDAGLDHLKGLTSLKELNVFATQVTDEGVKKLQQALPNCKITR